MHLIALRKALRSGRLLLGCALVAAAAHAETGTRVYAAQIPGGAVRILAVMLDGPWPAGGVRIDDESGAVLVPHVEPDRTAQAALDAASQRALAALQHLPGAGEANAKAGNALLALRLTSDWGFARAAGAAVELPSGAHPRSIRVVLLKAGGEPGATLGPVAVGNDPGPPAPAGLRAQAAPTGVTVQWQTARQASAVPVYAYEVERTFGAERAHLTAHPQLMTMQQPGQAVPFVDRAPPVEATLTYEVRLVDVLGVASAPASAQIYSPDFEAANPPADQTAKAGKGVVSLAWARVANPRTGALAVERSQLVGGPYELLTPEGLSAQTTTFKDEHVLAGAGYYYRVRAVQPNGALGPAADPVHAQPLSATTLAAPQALASEVGVNQVALSWKPVPGASLAGYIVERRASSSAPRWARLNTRLAPGPRYLDVIGPSQGGTFEYRVTAVATDESLSPPSEILRVPLRDTVPPAPPIVISTSGADARAQVRFAPAEPTEKTAQVALLRSDSPAEEGLVVGAPVPAKAAVIEDDWVQAGRAYWYRLVAFDAEGKRSQESEAFQIRIGAVDLPTPKAPQVTYTEQPARQAKLSFEAPPAHARVIVQVLRDEGRWQRVVGPMVGTTALDLDPPGPHARYRIVYVGESGGPGVPSEASAP